MFKFKKYQRAILGPSSSYSVATLEKKFGKTFPWVCMSFFKKSSQKSEILIKVGEILPKFWSFYQNFGHFNKKNKFSVFKQKLIIQYNHIKYSTSF